MSGWRRCDRCRKVRSTDDYEGEAGTCAACRAAPVPRPRNRAATVTRPASAPRPPAPADTGVGPRRPLLGAVGSGDLEVRERRARRTAQGQLVEAHAEEFEQLLQAARRAEGLRG